MKFNYLSTTQWGIACAAFLAPNATCPVRGNPSAVHGKYSKQSFVNTQTLDEEIGEEECGLEDWQDDSMNEPMMETPIVASFHKELDSESEILLAHPVRAPVRVAITSTTKPPFIFHDEVECEDEILLLPPQRTPVKVEVGFSGKPPFIFHDEFEEGDI